MPLHKIVSALFYVSSSKADDPKQLDDFQSCVRSTFIWSQENYVANFKGLPERERKEALVVVYNTEQSTDSLQPDFWFFFFFQTSPCRNRLAR